MISDSQMLINDKWLSFKLSHIIAPCHLSCTASNESFNAELFSCDHIIVRLYDLILLELAKTTSTSGRNLPDADNLRVQVSEALRHMPQMISISAKDHVQALSVNWMYAASDMDRKAHGVDLKCRVTLHRESTCSNKKYVLINYEGM